ncbi:hypothetical protein RJZ56_007109 [Blastomyces dermatitidis]|uniref:Uncharacterized protein n=3 Tax=Blastomyces TaxID=229219 RepID=A0A179UXG3_BLAGS|nr:uncharacterized protein BDBG_07335 [Blastomyces gilchristii SLH14081]XP_031580121.1 hypothetical protein, variant [Blastomyces gilchristii SLH14081]XP_045273281.1 uncharacterized protein BDCG_08823 [Blastomyces dermatitidis ER-3]XP_045282692.1 hypothetical protein, variant [Blastomyces dermatitidis ER-3]EGE82448.1 hypothetical protein BDDG_05392 [Blastomyces dermatitidis ATCC 18188]EQL29053.1 hypothetical protein BDFG_08260 [Blastomyces dermatitidis ATCC 26199]EEQ85554.1 hypothetical prote
MASISQDVKVFDAGFDPYSPMEQQLTPVDECDPNNTKSLSAWTTQEETLLPSPNPCHRPPSSPAGSDFDPSRGAKPLSPFYIHPTTRTSLEQVRSEAQAYCQGYKLHDAENGYQVPIKPSMDGQGSDRGLWGPCPNSRRKKSKWLGRLSRKQRLAVKGLIALFIAGSMVGIGLGISISLGGGVWKSKNQQGEIPRPG